MPPKFLTRHALIIPQYLAVVSYSVVAVFGLLQIHLASHRWIGFAVSFNCYCQSHYCHCVMFLYCCLYIKKTSVDFVFLVCAGAVIVLLILSILIQLSTVSQEMVALLGAQVAAVVIAIGCHVSDILS